MRETGYYWVNHEGNWIVNYFEDGLFYGDCYRYEFGLTADYFDKINEKRILNPDEK